MRSIPPSSSATRATTATASATTWRSEASNPSSRHDRTARHQSNTIAKPTSDAISSSGASIASSNSGALPPDTRKPPELTFQCYASQQRNSGDGMASIVPLGVVAVVLFGRSDLLVTQPRWEAAFLLLLVNAVDLFGGYAFNIALSRRIFDVAPAGPS